jgi:hypothetical protein
MKKIIIVTGGAGHGISQACRDLLPEYIVVDSIDHVDEADDLKFIDEYRCVDERIDEAVRQLIASREDDLHRMYPNVVKALDIKPDTLLPLKQDHGKRGKKGKQNKDWEL